jgi:hypothetical protein
VSSPLSAILVAGPELEGTVSPLLADAWDPNTRDYSSLFDGMDPIDAHVVHELCVVRGSGASVQNTGLEPFPNKLVDSLDQQVAASVRIALARLTAGGDIRIKSVRISHQDDSKQLAETTVRYVNLRSGQDESSAIVPMPSAPVPV